MVWLLTRNVYPFFGYMKSTMGSYNSCLMGKSHFPRIFNKLPKMVKNHPYLSCLDHLSVPHMWWLNHHFSVFILLSLEPPLFIICYMVNLSQSQFVMLKAPCDPCVSIVFHDCSMIVPWLFHGFYFIFFMVKPPNTRFFRQNYTTKVVTAQRRTSSCSRLAASKAISAVSWASCQGTVKNHNF